VTLRDGQTFWVLGTEWTIRFGPEHDESLREEDRWGHCWEQKREIAIRTDADISYVLFHEMYHAVEFSMGLDFEEEEVHAHSRGVYAVVIDNPELREEIFP
jgi:hypothetical protein